MILTHQLKSQVDLQWIFHDVHATNHNEFDEILIMISWSISTMNKHYYYLLLFSSNNKHTWIRSGSCECSQSNINASGTWFGISYGLDKTIAQRPRTPNKHTNISQILLFGVDGKCRKKKCRKKNQENVEEDNVEWERCSQYMSSNSLYHYWAWG